MSATEDPAAAQDGLEMEHDPKYEFEAPQFVDFDTSFASNDGADEWFDQKEAEMNAAFTSEGGADAMDIDSEEEPAEKEETTVGGEDSAMDVQQALALNPSPQPLVPQAPVQQRTQAPSVSRSTNSTSRSKKHGPSKTAAPVKGKKQSRIPHLKSSSTIQKRVAKPTQEQQQQRRRAPRVAPAQPSTTRGRSRAHSRQQARTKQQPAPTLTRQAKPRVQSCAAPVKRTRKPAPISSKTRLLAATNASKARSRVDHVAKKAKARIDASQVHSKRRVKLTIAKSPNFNKIKKKAIVLSSEELELQAIEQRRHAAAARRKANQEKVQAVLQSIGNIQPARSTKPLTIPKEFNFSTFTRSSSRSRERSAAQTPKPRKRALSSSRKAGLSTDPMSRNKRPRTATKPVPFKLATDARASGRKSRRRSAMSIDSDSESDSTVIRQIVRDFSSETPKKRGRSRSRSITKAKSPLLLSARRVRTKRVLSTAEREELEMKNAPQFKAKPVSQKVIQSSGDIGVPRIPKAKPTEFKEFQLRSQTRTRAPSTPREEKTHPFKARPFRNRPSSARPVRKRSLTKAQSPNITKPRPKKQVEETEPTFAAFKARPMPVNSTPQTRRMKRRSTQPEPFALESVRLSEQRRAELARKHAEEEAAAAAKREFKAKPILQAAPMQTQPRNVPLTQPEPFPLRSVQLSEQRQREFQDKLQREVEEEMRQAQFHARPMPDHQPFFVKKSAKPLTEVNSFELRSESRAAARHQFDQSVQEKLEAEENMRRQVQTEQEHEERRQLKELRKNLVHKPQPILKAKPVDVQRSTRSLTIPKSPNFATTGRSNRCAH